MAKQQIDTIYEKLRQGEDFATLANTWLKDPGSASNGGDWAGQWRWYGTKLWSNDEKRR